MVIRINFKDWFVPVQVLVCTLVKYGNKMQIVHLAQVRLHGGWRVEEVLHHAQVAQRVQFLIIGRRSIRF